MSARISEHGKQRMARALAAGYNPEIERVGPFLWLRQRTAFKRDNRKRGVR